MRRKKKRDTTLLVLMPEIKKKILNEMCNKTDNKYSHNGHTDKYSVLSVGREINLRI